MNVEPPREGQVYVKSGMGTAGGRGDGVLRHLRWRLEEVVRRRRGRRPDTRVTGWAARIEGAEYDELDSLRKKCRKLAWDEYLENGGDPDALSERQLVDLAEARRQALMRWYKKRR